MEAHKNDYEDYLDAIAEARAYSYTANELGEPKTETIKSTNMKNWIYLLLSEITALALWIVDPANVELHTSINPDSFGVIKWVASAILVVVGAVQVKVIADRSIDEQ